MANSLDIVPECSEMLTNAESDVDKISALLFAAQHIRSDECDSQSKAILFKSVGADFLGRMLRGHLSIPDSEDCPKETYVSTALAIITGFSVDPNLARNKEMLQLVPHILPILESCDDRLLEEALQYIRCIMQHPEGRRALLLHGTLDRFAGLYSRMKSDEIIDMTLILTQTQGTDDVWDQNAESFNSLILGVATEFEKNNSKRKFKLCSTLRCLIYSYNKYKPPSEIRRSQEWHKMIFRGLRDILTSRIEDEQRDPAMKLAAVMLDQLGVDWNDGSPESKKFHLLLVHLSSIEVRMQLEDQPLERILKNADLVTSCLTILEVAITQFLLDVPSGSGIKEQIFESFNAAGTAVLATINSMIDSSGSTRNTSEETFFIYGMIRFLSLGFAHEVLTPNVTVYKIMPFVVKVATDSFYSYKNCYEENIKIETNTSSHVVDVQTADIVPVLMPALRCFATQDEGRKIILSMMDVFVDSLNFHWSTIQCHLTQLQESGDDVNCGDTLMVINKDKTDVWSYAKSIIICIFELLIETIVIQPEVTENSSFSKVFAFVTKSLPDMDPNINVLRPLHATASVLGLLLIRHLRETPPENDPNVLLVVKSSLSFLKPYFNKVQSTEDSVFASKANPKFWVNIKELCALGTHTLRKLLELLPWIRPEIEKELSPTMMECLTSEDYVNVSSCADP